MKSLRTTRKTSIAFRGLILALAAVFLAACGGDADEATPTPEPDTGQVAAPTAPPIDEGTPDTVVSEDEITVLRPELPATPDATPESTPESTPEEPATPEADVEAEVVEEPAVQMATAEATPAETAVAAEEEADETTDLVDTASTPEATERPRTGDETFDHPGDGTGGSGMPGEASNLLEDVEVEVQATPDASPIALMSVIGCDVPDVPNYTGETTTFLLTADVNFRSGPGVDCEPLIDEPLGEGQIVIVSGGPVIQAEDESEWVQVDVDDTSGWITTEFIEPSE